MQQIKKLADNRMSLDFALRKAFSSYQFLKFFSNEESKIPDEVEVWYTANCSQDYKEFLEESTRRVIEDEFGIVLKRGAVVQSKTNSFPIVFVEAESSEESKLSEDDAATPAVTKPQPKMKTRQQETRLSVNGWIIYYLRKSNQWRIFQREKERNVLAATVDTQEEAISFAENNLTEAAARRIKDDNDRIEGTQVNTESQAVRSAKGESLYVV